MPAGQGRHYWTLQTGPQLVYLSYHLTPLDHRGPGFTWATAWWRRRWGRTSSCLLLPLSRNRLLWLVRTLAGAGAACPAYAGTGA